MKPENLNKSALGLLLVCFMIAAPVRAADQPFYVQADIGRSNATDSSVSLDENATGFRLAAGYQFIPWLAVDLGYVDFGTFEATATDQFGTPITAVASAKGLELGLVGRVPLGDRFALTAKLEQVWWDSHVDIGGQSESEDGSGLTYGVGVDWALNDMFVVTGAWQKYDLSDADVDLLSLGLRIRFGGSN